MRIHDNVRIVKEMFLALNSGNMTAVLNSFAEDAEWFIPGAPVVPYAGHRRGRDQIAECFGIIAKTANYERFEARQFLGDHEHVVVLGEERVKSRGTGRAFVTEWAMWFVVKKGRIVGFRQFLDTAAAIAAFRE